MILQTLAALSSAEEFFETLAVPFDPKVVAVHRLHILKRFREALGRAPDVTREQAQAALTLAYDDFAHGRGTRDFKVFRDAVPGFVPLSRLRPAVSGDP